MRLAALALACLSPFLALVLGFAQPQEPPASPRELLNRPSADAQIVREQLLLHGDNAVQPVVQALAAEHDASPIRVALLIGVLEKLNTARSQEALERVLSDARPVVRGYATSALGRMGARCAIPSLTRLLEDDAEYGREVTTDPYRERSLTVAGAAMESLERLTGLREKRRKSPSERRRGFEAWWSKNRSKLACNEP